MANQNLNFTITAKDLTRGAFRGIQKSLSIVRNALLNFKTGIAAVAGAAGLGLLVKSSLQSIDTLGKTASKLGVTSQALQKLRYASELAGVETRTVDMAVQRFTRRLAEAAQNTGEAKDALKELGLNAKTLARLPLEKQMLKLSDAFAKVKNSGDRVRLAFKLFDSEGVAFVNTLQGGSAALQQMFNDAQSLGFILSSGAVRGVEQANDAMSKLGMMLGGVRDQIVAGLAPALTFIVDLVRNKLVDGIKQAGGIENFAKQLALSVINLTETTALAVQTFVNRIVTGINFIIDAAQALGNVIQSKTLMNLKKAGKFAFVSAGFFNQLRQSVNGTANATMAMNNAMQQGAPIASTYGKKLSDMADAAKDTKARLEDASVRGLGRMEDSLLGVMQGTMSVKDAFKSMASSIISDLMRIAIQQAITSRIAGFMSGIFAGGDGGGGVSGGAGTAGVYYPAPRAAGGPVSKNTPYMVGERGRELFVPNQSGSIVPNHRLGGGGVVINQTINLSTGVQQTVRAEMTNMLPQIAQAAKGAVLDAKRRGGSFSTAFGA